MQPQGMQSLQSVQMGNANTMMPPLGYQMGNAMQPMGNASGTGNQMGMQQMGNAMQPMGNASNANSMMQPQCMQSLQPQGMQYSQMGNASSMMQPQQPHNMQQMQALNDELERREKLLALEGATVNETPRNTAPSNARMYSEMLALSDR